MTYTKSYRHLMIPARGALCNSLAVASVVFVFLELPVSAIEKPQSETTQPEYEAQDAAPSVKQSRLLKPDVVHPKFPKQLNQIGQADPVKLEKVPMLGIGGSPVSGALAKHLGLENGYGLTVYHVVPDSTAAEAGLKEHDVLTEFNGQAVGCQNSLRKAVMSCKPGDSISLKYMSNGKVKEASAELGDRLVHANDNVQSSPQRGIAQNRIKRFSDGHEQFIDQHMQRHMREMKQLLENNHGVQMNLHGLLKNIGDSNSASQSSRPNRPSPQGIHDIMGSGLDIDQLQSLQKSGSIPKGMNIQFSSNSTLTRRDAQGAVSLKTMNGLKELIVKDNQGNVVFEGPYKTDADKAAVPEEIRIRLNQMNFDQDNDCNYRLHTEGEQLQLNPQAQPSAEDVQ